MGQELGFAHKVVEVDIAFISGIWTDHPALASSNVV